MLQNTKKENVTKQDETGYNYIQTETVEISLDDKSQAARYNHNKPRMSLVPYDGVVEVARVLEFGASKYDAHNWRKGLPFSQTIDSIERHVGAFKNGEDLDLESNLSHMAHVATNALFLLQYIKDGMDVQFDDRYKK